MTDPTPPRPTRVQEALKLDAVPTEKWHQMVQRTVLGLGFIALGVLGAIKLGWAVYVSIAVCIFGATLWSTQLVVSTVKQLIPLLKAVLDAVRGKEAP